MKKVLFFSSLALAVLLTVSCQKNNSAREPAPAERHGRHQRRRHCRRHRADAGVSWAGDRSADDGRPDDGVQYGNRGWRASRIDCCRRCDVRLPEGAAVRTEGRDVGCRGRLLADAEHGFRCCVRPIGHDRRGRARTAGHLGNVA